MEIFTDSGWSEQTGFNRLPAKLEPVPSVWGGKKKGRRHSSYNQVIKEHSKWKFLIIFMVSMALFFSSILIKPKDLF